MNKHAAELLTTALRSGEYTQGVSTLENEGTFCCLGVLCKIAEKEGIKVGIEDNVLEGNTLAFQDDVKEWSGVNTDEGAFILREMRIDGLQQRLTDLNDEDLTFPQIADVIDYFWEGL